MKKLIAILLVLAAWNGVLTYRLFQNERKVKENYAIEEARAVITHITSLSYRLPLLLRVATNDILGPTHRVEVIRTTRSASGMQFPGGIIKATGYSFELPSSTTEDQMARAISQFKWYAAYLLGISHDEWPLELKIGNNQLSISNPEIDLNETRILFDVEMQISTNAAPLN